MDVGPIAQVQVKIEKTFYHFETSEATLVGADAMWTHMYREAPIWVCPSLRIPFFGIGLNCELRVPVAKNPPTILEIFKQLSREQGKPFDPTC